DRITLYGVSYGTVVAQAYAAAHPDRLNGLVLDAPIDRSLTATHLWTVAATGFDDAVAATEAWCSADAACHQGLFDPAAAQDRLYRQFDSDGDLSAQITNSDGQSVKLTLSETQYDAMTVAAMYSTQARMSWLRALDAYDRGDDRPLVRLYHAWLGPGDSSTFDYYATWCADVRTSPTARDDDFDAYIAALRQGHPLDSGSIDV